MPQVSASAAATLAKEDVAADYDQQDWAAGMRNFWQPGEEAALRRLRSFVASIESHKRPDRHRADLCNTSLLSPHLRFGEISPRTCYVEAMRAPAHLRHGFIRRILWRDLSYAELYRWPEMPVKSQRPHYEEQTWTGSAQELRRWQRGRTGFPLIDAAMRQLWHEGYINNYMRHVTAGFLVDYLDISWKEGFRWYDYTLVDSDAAINARLWQQGGHSGISQWNFVMHPVYAAKNADPTGNYVRRWVPELAALPAEFIHCPWEAAGELMSRGLKLGIHYPRRLVLDIEAARKRHLRSVLQVRRSHPEAVSKDGTEYLLLRDGSQVLLRTRDDIRQDTEELIVAQAPDGILHKKRFGGGGASARGRREGGVRPQQLLLDDEVSSSHSRAVFDVDLHIV
jgi:deoxyribodipyrimidine photolyase